MLAFQFDRLVVSRNFSAALYAVYAVGAVELPISVLVQQAVNSTLMPALTRLYLAGDVAGMAALWSRRDTKDEPRAAAGPSYSSC